MEALVEILLKLDEVFYTLQLHNVCSLYAMTYNICSLAQVEWPVEATWKK